MRNNRYSRLTRSERGSRYINKTWPVQKPVKDADIWNVILKADECTECGSRYMVSDHLCDKCMEYSKRKSILKNGEPPDRDLGTDAFHFHNQRKDT